MKILKAVLTILCISIGIMSLILLSSCNSNSSQNEEPSAGVDTPWGPDRKTFTWEECAEYATINSITDNPSVGDERNFVRIREYTDDAKYVDQIEIQAGKTYEVYVYYHNNAKPGEIGNSATGIADGLAIKSSFPKTIKSGEKATVNATIFASDTDPKEVWDGVYLLADQNVTLSYVPGTAIFHNGGELDGQPIGADGSVK